ncbi:MAG: hypothetical protein JW910_03420 [Anaerolineae bacterium]|nr:hypothetical protein [Anaerolineae bacterium]
MKTRAFVGVLIALVIVLGLVPIAAAQTGPRVQEITGHIDNDTPVLYYELPGLQAGEVVYLWVEATSGDLDTYLFLGLAGGEGAGGFGQMVAEDDDGGNNYNSRLTYRVDVAGDYRVAMTRYLGYSTSGDFRLLVGIDDPAVFDGTAKPSTDALVLPVDLGINVAALHTTDCSLLAVRPYLSGSEQTVITKYFVVHYTASGYDAVTPEYLDMAVEMLDTVWQTEVDQFGWPAPPADCGEGGDERYDVYLLDTLGSEDAMGYTSPEELVGDNPNSPLIEGWATYSYLAIDNDFDGWDDPRAALYATAAHEFHHAIQFGYDIGDSGEWLYEATASWMETQVFPVEEDATPYIVDLFDLPDLCVGSTPDDPYYGTRIYAEWLIIDSIAQDYGTEAIQQLWQLIGEYDGMENFYEFAAALGTTPQEIMTRVAIRNLLRDYALGDRFEATVHIENSLKALGDVSSVGSGVEELGVNYVHIPQPGLYSFSIDQPGLEMTLVGVDVAAGTAQVFRLGQSGTVDTTPFDHAFVIVLNTAQHDDPYSCTAVDWTITVGDGTGQALVAADGEAWDASNFIAPGEEVPAARGEDESSIRDVLR